MLPAPARSARLLRSSSSRASSKLLRAANRQSRRSHLRRCKTPRPPSSIDVVPSRAVRAARRASSRAARLLSRGHDVGIPSAPAALVCVGARTSHLCYNGRSWFIGRDYGTTFCRPCSCRCRNQRLHLESSNLLDLLRWYTTTWLMIYDLGADLSTTPYSAPDPYTQSAVQLEWDERLDADVHQRSSQPGQVAESEDGAIGAPC